MHSLFNQSIAKQHMEQLQREAAAERKAVQLRAQHWQEESQGNVGVYWHSLNILHLYWVRVVSLFGRTLIIHQVKSDAWKYEEIKQNLKATLTSMRDVYPEYDDQLIEQIVRRFEEQLLHKSRGSC
ncbi:MAG TPA: hypothetical protein VFQ30_10250 [Ktedonobacteraceae bacterium]|nr:hypothetical protein [Ktedonobacteraceae bacterium]